MITSATYTYLEVVEWRMHMLEDNINMYGIQEVSLLGEKNVCQRSSISLCVG